MNNWIKVEDKKPENEVDVLCFDDSSGEQYVARMYFGGWSILSGVHVVSDSYECQPTHWMPLPESPVK
ncbi:DUF551 domain-containing protein [Kluyvera sp. SCKS090646]|uniref:DUF551 domain-containing protein n=1 Tax=Kluyvera sichuanensis TaxID=2725494 RepID=A0ABR6RR31_9ENTR|nr:DUF551 domain-containing protein [Kluyvera sichuanensis]MBC1185572.1 DUF551 domain-containing protein [Kluyvera sichuanensis]